MQNAVFVTNQPHALKSVPGARALNKTISSTTITASTDTELGPSGTGNLADNTEFLQCQVVTDAVYLNLHADSTPTATDSLLMSAGSSFIMSRSEWLNSTWKRVTTDAALTAMQLRAS